MTNRNTLNDRIAEAFADYGDKLWANAFGTAPLGKPEPASRLGPSGECRFRKGAAQ